MQVSLEYVTMPADKSDDVFDDVAMSTPRENFEPL